MFSLLVSRLCRLNLVLLSVVMVNLLPSSVLLTSVLTRCHCPLVLKIILQPFKQIQHGNQKRTTEAVGFFGGISYSIDFAFFL